MTRHDPLLQPFRLKHLDLRNRIVSTAHEPAYSEDGLPKDRYRLYHEEKAKGGIALTMIGGSSVVSRDSPPAFGNLHLWDDAVVPWLARLAEGVHAHGAAVMCQITHLGRRTTWSTGDWLPVLAPSPLREPAHRAFPKAIEAHDIRRIVADYAAAARRCREAGLDGVEIEAYGHLFDAFWSPLTNRRDDEWGGDLDNRLRFSRAVLAAIRAAVGADYIVGLRLVVDEAAEGGLDAEQGLEIARRLTADGGVDFLNVIKGHIDTDEGLSHVIPGMGTPAGPYLELCGRVRREIGLPVLHAARINDVATARHAIAEGLLDLVGMTRAHMADPHIAAKIAAGEEHRIRPCVGAGYCIDRIYEGGEALCLHNPATGREASLPHRIPRNGTPALKVVVVGAGPAGLEAARVGAERGHQVVVFEAGAQPGGQVRLAAAVKRRREIVGIVDWLAEEVARLGVTLRCNHLAEAGDVLAERPDVVIVATGGLPNLDFLTSGADLATSTWDILAGQVAPAGEVLVFDDHGGHQAISCAEFLVAAGARLRYVTPERVIAPEVGGVNYPAYLKAFDEGGVAVTLNRRLVAIRREGNGLAAELASDYSGTRETVGAQQIVVEHGTLPADALYHELLAGSRNGGEVDIEALLAGRPQGLTRNPDGAYRLFRVGDAVASRNIHAAILDSLRLCQAL